MAVTTSNQTQEVQAESKPLLTDTTAPTETDQEQISRISAAIARAKAALEEVKAKASEYDAQYKASETASSYLLPPIQKAQAAIEEFAAKASSLKDKTVEIPTKAWSRTLSAANGALEQVTALSREYDEKYKLSSKVQKAVSIPKDKCTTALVEASALAASVSASANAQLQGVNHGICSRVVALASSSASVLFSTAAALENRFDIESKTVSASTRVAGKASEYDEQYSVKERLGSFATAGLEKAQGLDSKVTGGKVAPVVLSAFEKGLAMATDGLGYVKSGYQMAKEQRQGEEIAHWNSIKGQVEEGAQGEQKAKAQTEESGSTKASEPPAAATPAAEAPADAPATETPAAETPAAEAPAAEAPAAVAPAAEAPEAADTKDNQDAAAWELVAPQDETK